MQIAAPVFSHSLAKHKRGSGGRRERVLLISGLIPIVCVASDDIDGKDTLFSHTHAPQRGHKFSDAMM
jgi:hypothetical protein